MPLLGTKRLDELPLEILMRFQFSISHVPGKSLTTADALSRAPAPDTMTEEDRLLGEEVEAYVNGVIQSIPATERRLEEIRMHQEEDEIFQQVTEYCRLGWPALPGVLKPYHQVASELTVEKSLLMRGSRVVIPASMRVSMLDRLHTGHQGITKSRECAKLSMWWPGISCQLEEVVKSCPDCCKNSSQGVQPLIPSRLPKLPWQKVGTDLFEFNKSTYLLVVDYYSRWIETARLNRTTSEDVIQLTSSIFARHGIPEVVVSDNGPQFSAESYTKFAQTYGFEHITSSPYYPRSNGEAERAFQTVKNLLKKSGDPYLALLAYRTTPLQCGYSPAQLLMSRNLRSTLPDVSENRVPKVVDSQVFEEKDEQIKDRQKRNHDSWHKAKELPQLEPGDCVDI